jgi:hypothetical protein
VLVIALFYTDRISVSPLIAAGVFLALLVLAARMKVKRISVYVILVLGVWLAVLASGIHATVAGILVAAAVPVRRRIQPERFFAIARERLAELEASSISGEFATLNSEPMDTLGRLHEAIGDVVAPGTALERYLHPVTAYVILPLFALFNAGIVLDSGVVAALANPVGLGVLLGLLIGKQAGITAASWVVVRCRFADMPAGVTWGQLYGSAILAGVGFTMALFVSDLAIPSERLLGSSKVAILAGSALCAAAGYLVLRSALDRVGFSVRGTSALGPSGVRRTCPSQQTVHTIFQVILRRLQATCRQNALLPFPLVPNVELAKIIGARLQYAAGTASKRSSNPNLPRASAGRFLFVHSRKGSIQGRRAKLEAPAECGIRKMPEQLSRSKS